MSISQNFPSTRPSLNLNFARSKTLDPRITFTRTSTGTYVDENGLIKTAPANSPRFDHDPVTGESLGLLIEESRTNLLTYSQDFTQSIWDAPVEGRSRATRVTSTGIDDPSGGTTAATYKNGGTLADELIWRIAGGGTANVPYTMSVWIRRRVGTGQIDFVVGDNITVEVTNQVTTEWKRISVTATPTTTLVRAYILIKGINDEIDIWGYQLEQGSFPTSYIPTSGSTATRTPDNAKIEGSNFSSWFNNNEFSIFTHHKFPSVPPNYYPRVFDINTGSDAYRLNHYHDPSIYGTKIGCSVVENNIVQSAVSTSSYDIGDDLRMASCFKDNDFASYVNGALIGTDNTGVFSTTQRTVLYIGSSVNGSSPINGTISQLTYYPVRLSNNILQSLTK